ncbi:MAG: sugar kinase [Myxococcales bacterium]|nr:sugar kinase [Myxococcales bacterium]
MTTLVAIGHVTHDYYGSRVEAGGSAFYAAQVWRHLGARARVVTTIGTDFSAPEAFEGLDVCSLREGETTAFRNLYHGDMRTQSIKAVAPAVDVSAFPRHWGAPDVLFLCPVFGEVDLADWVQQPAKTLAIGLQGWVKCADPDDLERLKRVIRCSFNPSDEALRAVDVAFCSDEDLAGQDGLFDRLRANVACLVLTHGVSGCEVFCEGEHFRVGIYPARQLDPTGAGDSFAAGFLFARSRSETWRDAARFGAAVASVVVEAEAGAALPSVSDAHERFHDIRVETRT